MTTDASRPAFMLCRPREPLFLAATHPVSHFGHHPGACLRVGRATSMASTPIARALRAGAVALPFAVLCAPAAVAQLAYPGAAPSTAAAGMPAPPSRNPVCLRLEGQLAIIDRGGVDPA